MTKQRPFGRMQFWPWLGAWLLVTVLHAYAADLDEAKQLFGSGQYKECIAQAKKGLEAHADDEEWQLLLSQAQLATGQYAEARDSITNALTQNSRSLRLRWQARQAFLSNGDTEAANRMAEEVLQLGSARPWAYRDDAPSLVVFGRALLLRGVDPKSVLDVVFANARKADPKLGEIYLASGQLALDKHDFALAAKKFQEGLKQAPHDPELQCGLAQAFAPSDQSIMLNALDTALEYNSNHIASLLLLADHSIDAEDYAEAAELLDRVKAIDPWQPEAWAYRAVLAHLQNQPDAEAKARETGLKYWPDNPRVDHLIGLKLSQNYRFAEGAAHEQQALKFDHDYLPAKAQLAQDLLRLGDEAEGWKLAQEVQKQDGYDVQAYNLVGLHEKMAGFATLTNEDFLVRMSRHEAAVYGEQVLNLLSRARSNLCAKYGIELKRPTIVEVFPEQKDFAVRTFGMPGNPGYLGVCFGRVVTANSPAAQTDHAVNWQAVLWHEFCHVVTLQLTGNKMPRWLSEGISVYEEIQANPCWGQAMNPDYREMVLGDDFTPVSKLSGAFLSPRSDLHLQFAYYEASLVVEFLVKRFGIEKLKAVLTELGRGTEINQALEQNTVPIDKLDEEFAAFARERAEKLAPGLDFEKPESASRPASARRARRGSPDTPFLLQEGPSLQEWAKAHPTNFWALTMRVREMIEAKNWSEARPILERLIDLYPGFTGGDSAYRLLAATDRALGDTNAEEQVLIQFASRDKEAADAYLRLMEIGTDRQQWPVVIENAKRYLAVNPLVAPPYRFLAKASETTGDATNALTAYTALAQLDPPDPADVHFHLAELLHKQGDPRAREHVLKALEEAPRFRPALRLLLELNREPGQTRIAGSPATEQARR